MNYGNTYSPLLNAQFKCPKCGEVLKVIVISPIQHLSDATTGYNNGVECESCDFKATIGYNGGWGTNTVVVPEEGESYYTTPALNWHDKMEGIKTDDEIREWIQERLNAIFKRGESNETKPDSM